MIERSYSFFKVQRLLVGAIVTFATSCLFALCWFLGTYLLNEFRDTFSLRSPRNDSHWEAVAGHRKNFDLGNALTTRNVSSYFPLPELDKELLCIHQRQRPDIIGSGGKVLLSSAVGQDSVLAGLGEELYLTFDREKGGLVFSREKTPFVIQPRLGSDEKMLLHAKWQLNAGGIGGSIQQCFLMPPKTSLHQDALSQEFKSNVKPLYIAKCYAPDAIFQVYGGEKYSQFAKLYRLEIPSDGASTLSFVTEKDVLIWDEGLWRKPKGHENTREYPIAEVCSISPQKIELLAFDREGKEMTSISLFITSPHMTPPRWNDVFVKPKQRTLHSVSCKLGGKNVVLKEGDWYLKTSKGWKVLKNAEELEAYLHYKVAGDLFVFDKIRKTPQGKIIEGHYFDAKRCHSQVVQLPLIEKKKSLDSEKKKIRKSDIVGTYDVEV